jgi:F-type H+-transporting ATPase subunit b
MKITCKIGRLSLYIVALFLCIHMLGYEALASEAEGSGGWRPIYDIIMKWVNFGILSFLIVKFGKKPLMDFLRGQKDELAKEIGQLEEEKEKFDENLKKTIDLVEKGDSHITKIKERIEEQGRKAKEKIISDARKQSVLMIEESKRKASSQLVQAKTQFRAELIDLAVALATEKLPEVVKEDDQQELLNKYLDAARV